MKVKALTTISAIWLIGFIFVGLFQLVNRVIILFCNFADLGRDERAGQVVTVAGTLVSLYLFATFLSALLKRNLTQAKAIYKTAFKLYLCICLFFCLIMFIARPSLLVLVLSCLMFLLFISPLWIGIKGLTEYEKKKQELVSIP